MNLCPDCGYPNDPSEHRCEKCGIRFEDAYREYAALGEALAEAPDPPPVWKGEVTRRVARFRERHGLQPALPMEFPEKKPRGKVIPFPGQPIADCGLRIADSKPPDQVGQSKIRNPKSEIQQSFDFTRPRRASLAVAPLLEFPVAPLWVRAKSGALDAGIVTIGYGLYFTSYYLAGGALPWHRLTLLSSAAALALLPMFYLFLFLTLTAGTPGMIWTGLRLVDFDGRPASLRRRLIRVLASAASGVSFLLGFLWAAVDEEQLSWNDRMSETCLVQVTRML